MLAVQKLINESIHQRSQIWKSYDGAVASEQELNSKFSQSFNSLEPVSAIPSLTTENVPTIEVQAAIAQLETVQKQIELGQLNIQQNETEIARLKKQARNLITILSATGAVILGILVISLKNQTQNNNDSLQPSNTRNWVVQVK